jgi:hypothetical protein
MVIPKNSYRCIVAAPCPLQSLCTVGLSVDLLPTQPAAADHTRTGFNYVNPVPTDPCGPFGSTISAPGHTVTATALQRGIPVDGNALLCTQIADDNTGSSEFTESIADWALEPPAPGNAGAGMESCARERRLIHRSGADRTPVVSPTSLPPTPDVLVDGLARRAQTRRSFNPHFEEHELPEGGPSDVDCQRVNCPHHSVQRLAEVKAADMDGPSVRQQQT